MNTDLLIIGGGINGVGIARDAAGRGLSVVLCEQGDLASATSSASSKLIHGGLRYLEQAQFRLVREALHEREVLQKIAPHLVSPLEFILPQDRHIRSPWIIRTGLFLYNLLARDSSLPNAHTLPLHNTLFGSPLHDRFVKAFSYYDCQVDDARLVIANALSASANGAQILTRTKFLRAQRQQHHWVATLAQAKNNEEIQIQAKCIINAAGPWVAKIAAQLGTPQPLTISLSKGSHLIVPKLYQGNHAYLLQNIDKRIVFLIPFQQHFTLIGTTDVNYHGDPAAVHISHEEIDYLCQTVNRYLRRAINANDIIHSWSGVRTLKSIANENPATLSRDYELLFNTDKQQAPYLSVIGGKITTYRRLAEHALKLLKPYFKQQTGPWTAHSPLAGSNIPSLAEFTKTLIMRYPQLDTVLLQRYARTYGSASEIFLKDIVSMNDLGRHFGADLYQCEVDYLVNYEWAQTAEDILWRRTKLGLFLTTEETAVLQDFILNRYTL